ncbi:hypothetical protein ACP4OV_005012 [Aristida adscensionis]
MNKPINIARMAPSPAPAPASEPPTGLHHLIKTPVTIAALAAAAGAVTLLIVGF